MSLNRPLIPGFLPPSTPNMDQRPARRDRFGVIEFDFHTIASGQPVPPVQVRVERANSNKSFYEDLMGIHVYSRERGSSKILYFRLLAKEKNLSPGDYIVRFYINNNLFLSKKVEVLEDYVVDGISEEDS